MSKNSLSIVFGLMVLAGCSQTNTASTPAETTTTKVATAVESVQTTVSQEAKAATAQASSMVQNAADAIKQSVNQGSVQQQIDYLLAQAKNFVGAEKYDQVAAIANQILTKLDSNSTQAKDLLQMAQSHLGDKAKAMMDGAKDKLGSFMK